MAIQNTVLGGSITPGWAHDVRIDIPVVFAVQPASWTDLSWDKMIDKKYTYSMAASDSYPHIIYESNYGWRPEHYCDNLNVTYEQTASDTQQTSMTLSDSGSGSSMIAYNNQRKYQAPEFAFIPTNTARAIGDVFYRKSIKAGDSNPINNGSDQASFPAPSTITPVPLDRIAVSTSNTNPEETLIFRFKLPGVSGSNTVGVILTYYFVGVPTWTEYDAYEGTGFYAVELSGDGRFRLVEKQSTTGNWITRANGFWSLPADVPGRDHYMSIKSDATDNGAGVYNATVINLLFRTDAGTIGGSQSLPTGNQASQGWSHSYPYNIVRRTPRTTAQSLNKVRLDCRRDCMPSVYFGSLKYYPTAYAYTPVFSLVAQPLNVGSNVSNYRIGFLGSFPSGTTATVELFWCDPTSNGTLTSCTAVSTTTVTGSYAYREFYVPEGKQFYRAKITSSSSSDGFKAPRVYRLLAVRDAISRVSTPTFVSAKANAISITGQGRDPASDSCSINITDPSGSLSRLKTRSMLPFDVKLYYDSTDRTKYSILFRGRICQAKFSKIWPKGYVGDSGPTSLASNNPDRQYPATDTGTYKMRCLGEFVSLKARKAPQTYDFSHDPSTGRPYLVSDIIRILLLAAGYPATCVDVPNYTVELLTQVGGDEYKLEVYSEIFPFINELAGQFLNAWFVFDTNASNGGTGDLGCWRLKRAPVANSSGKYRALAAFTTAQSDSSNHSGSSIPSVLPGAFPLVSDGINSTPTLRPRAILRDFYETMVEPPEGNQVIVTGVGTATAGSGIIAIQQKIKLTQTAVNWKAVNFGQNGTDHPLPDPTYADYTDGTPNVIYICDPSLTTQDAVNWRCRRTYDLACHAKYWTIFAAPLVLVTDPDDSLQLRPRPLHFGDIVLINGVQNVVNSVQYEAQMGDGHNAATWQNTIAIYECYQVPALTPDQSYTGLDEIYRTIFSVPR